MTFIKTNLKSIGYLFATGIVGIALGIILQSARAWTEPTAAPPNVNIGAPLTTGALAQNKTGSIGTSGSISALGDVQAMNRLCIGNDCRNAWPAGGTPGPQGPAGPQGAQGPQGPAGPTTYFAGGLYGYCQQNYNTTITKSPMNTDCSCPSGFTKLQTGIITNSINNFNIYSCYKN